MSPRWAAGAGAVLVAAAALGFGWVGSNGAVEPETAPTKPPLASRTPKEGDGGSASAPPGRVDAGGDGARDLRAEPEAIAAVLRSSEDPRALVAAAIDGMSRDELVRVLEALTGRDREELERMRDPHRFARSLAAIALSGIATEEAALDAPRVDFATRLAGASAVARQPGRTRRVIDTGSTRIFGLFPLAEGTQVQVLAKWYRTDRPELLWFGELPVRERNGRGFIRLERSEGWREGDYRLEIYALGEELAPIAAGDYEVRGDRRPLRVAF